MNTGKREEDNGWKSGVTFFEIPTALQLFQS